MSMSEDTKLLMGAGALVVAGAVSIALVASCSAIDSSKGDVEVAESRQSDPIKPIVYDAPVEDTRDSGFDREIGIPEPVDPIEPAEIEPVEEVFQVGEDEDFGKRGVETFHAGEYDKSVAYFTAAVDKLPGRAWNHYMLGLAQWKTGDLEGASDNLGRASELDDKNIKTFVNLARVQNDRGDFEAALEASRKAVDLDSADGTALFLEGRSLHNLGRHEEAIESLAASLAMQPDNGFALNLYGLSLIEQGLFDAAVEVLAVAIESEPEVGFIRNNYGMALERSGRYDAAVEQYAKASELDPSHEKAGLNLARLQPLAESSAEAIALANAKVPSGFQPEGEPVELVAESRAEPVDETQGESQGGTESETTESASVEPTEAPVEPVADAGDAEGEDEEAGGIQ